MQRKTYQLIKTVKAYFENIDDEFVFLSLLEDVNEISMIKDMNTFLQFVAEEKVVGTPKHGNMPLKMVRAVTSRFVNPPLLEYDNSVHKIRSERQCRELYFLHILAESGNLIKTHPGKRWELTQTGEMFLQNNPIEQLVHLFITWWIETNWFAILPFKLKIPGTPTDFNLAALVVIISYSEEARIVFKEFAEKIMEILNFSLNDMDEITSMVLQSIIQIVVPEILHKFGLAELFYLNKANDESVVNDLITFTINPLGRIIFANLANAIVKLKFYEKH